MPAERDATADFVNLMHEHQGLVHRICGVYADSADDRDDLFQEILLQAWRAYGSYRADAKFSTWLYRVGLNTALFRTRKRKSQRRVSLQHDADVELVEDGGAETDPDVEVLYESIQQLPRLDRAIVLLHLERHTYQEIAEITGLSRKNVSVRLVRVKARLRQLMLANGYEGGERS